MTVVLAWNGQSSEADSVKLTQIVEGINGTAAVETKHMRIILYEHPSPYSIHSPYFRHLSCCLSSFTGETQLESASPKPSTSQSNIKSDTMKVTFCPLPIVLTHSLVGRWLTLMVGIPFPACVIELHWIESNEKEMKGNPTLSQTLQQARRLKSNVEEEHPTRERESNKQHS